MHIRLPNDPKLEACAFAAGFSSVEEYVRHLIEQASHQDQCDASKEDNEREHHPLSREQWNREFQAFLEFVEPGIPDFDDSRESIYPVR